MDAVAELETLWADVFGEPPPIHAEAPVLADVLVAALPSAPPYGLEPAPAAAVTSTTPRKPSCMPGLEDYEAAMRILLPLAALLIATPALAAQPTTEAPPAAVSPAATQDPVAYMASVAKQPGVTVTGSGLAYKIIRSGPAGGPHPRLGDQVQVSYEGQLVNGSVFDSSKANGGPATLTVGQLVPGWNEALQLMRPGDDWTLYVPPSLGYGDQATGPIPANSVMIFHLQLLSIVPPAG